MSVVAETDYLAMPDGADPDVLESASIRKRSKWMRKTQLCNYHAQNNCTFGDDCYFAHSQEELQKRPDLRKTQLCPDFANGLCEKAHCSFAHGEDELKPFPTLKQKLCMWYRKGKCQNGEACCFAHGRKEQKAPRGKGAKEPEAVPSGQEQRAKETTSGKEERSPAAEADAGKSDASSIERVANVEAADVAAADAIEPVATVMPRSNEAPAPQRKGGTKVRNAKPRPLQLEAAATCTQTSASRQVGLQESFPQPQTQPHAGDFSTVGLTAPWMTGAQGSGGRVIFAWRRTPLSSKGLPFVPSSGLGCRSDSAEDDTSTCAETAESTSAETADSPWADAFDSPCAERWADIAEHSADWHEESGDEDEDGYRTDSTIGL